MSYFLAPAEAVAVLRATRTALTDDGCDQAKAEELAREAITRHRARNVRRRDLGYPPLPASALPGVVLAKWAREKRQRAKCVDIATTELVRSPSGKLLARQDAYPEELDDATAKALGL